MILESAPRAVVNRGKKGGRAIATAKLQTVRAPIIGSERTAPRWSTAWALSPRASTPDQSLFSVRRPVLGEQASRRARRLFHPWTLNSKSWHSQGPLTRSRCVGVRGCGTKPILAGTLGSSQPADASGPLRRGSIRSRGPPRRPGRRRSDPRHNPRHKGSSGLHRQDHCSAPVQDL